jgi:CBS domain-containing protein
MATVSDILKSKKKDVYSISPDATVFDALKLMDAKGVGALMVKAGEQVVGIISERDYARKVTLKGKSSKNTSVKEIMTADMFSVRPEHTVDECMVLMTGKRIRHIPVFDQGKFVGIVSIGDVIKSIISHQEMLIEQLNNYVAGKYI